MWPWEHLALAYLLYALYTRGRLGRPPGDRDTLALAVGTQFPDLVDKPLGWGLGLLRDGVFAHSLFVAVPVSLLVAGLAAHRGWAAVGWAFGFGYLSHLPADALYGVVFGQPPNVGFLLWPLVGQRTAARTGLLENLTYYLSRYQSFLLSGDGLLYLGVEIALLAAATAVWVADGTPGRALLRLPDRD
jgi:hypothetical protein